MRLSKIIAWCSNTRNKLSEKKGFKIALSYYSLSKEKIIHYQIMSKLNPGTLV